jgi:hypothetical protein
MSLVLRTLAVLGAAVLALTAAPAQAAPPPYGDWTYIRADGYVHYACKLHGKVRGRWVIRTATFLNGNTRDAFVDDVPVWAAVVRGSNRNVVDQRKSRAWRGGFVHMALRGAVNSDRLWIQSAGYGPVRPWRDGFRVARITRCDIA